MDAFAWPPRPTQEVLDAWLTSQGRQDVWSEWARRWAHTAGSFLGSELGGLEGSWRESVTRALLRAFLAGLSGDPLPPRLADEAEPDDDWTDPYGMNHG